jgi:hypothetical protein
VNNESLPLRVETYEEQVREENYTRPVKRQRIVSASGIPVTDLDALCRFANRSTAAEKLNAALISLMATCPCDQDATASFEHSWRNANRAIAEFASGDPVVDPRLAAADKLAMCAEVLLRVHGQLLPKSMDLQELRSALAACRTGVTR